jgi:S-adenosylmethionine decarboxylase
MSDHNSSPGIGHRGLTGNGGLQSTDRTVPDLFLGTEWIVDAHGCDPSSLRSCAALARLFARIVDELGLHPAGEPVWHVFPGHGGITGVLLLTESHLACHTFPERGFAAFDLYCCRPRQEWPWAERLGDALGASEVHVRSVPRGELPRNGP